jgi:hypothetical protein
MNYDIKAHPTRYNGTQFRSRLEAKWAAFFDLCGWAWEYEPCDLNGWVPDFLIRGGENNLFVEVKPFNWFQGCSENHNLIRSSSVADKIFNATCEEILLLGSYPVGRGAFGYLLESDKSPNDWGLREKDEKWSSDAAILNFGKSFKYDVSANLGSYRFRLGNEYSGDHHLEPTKAEEIESLWRAASNIVQKQFA